VLQTRSDGKNVKEDSIVEQKQVSLKVNDFPQTFVVAVEFHMVVHVEERRRNTMMVSSRQLITCQPDAAKPQAKLGCGLPRESPGFSIFGREVETDERGRVKNCIYLEVEAV
jgi:hypothetical protein